MLTFRFGFSFFASAASWKPGARLTFAASVASRIVAGSGPVELLRSLPISIFTWVMIGPRAAEQDLEQLGVLVGVLGLVVHQQRAGAVGAEHAEALEREAVDVAWPRCCCRRE